MRLEAAIQGNLKEFMKEEVSAATKAVAAGIKEVTEGIRTDLKGQVSEAGLGMGVANAWRAKYYQMGEVMKATGFIYTRAPDIITAFNYGVTIRSEKGLYLAIPTPAAPKKGENGKRINPMNFPESSLGRLRFVYRPGNISLLVVDDLRARTGKRGGFARASASAITKQRGVTTVVMFILVRQVSMKKKLDSEMVCGKWEGELGNRILGNWHDTKE